MLNPTLNCLKLFERLGIKREEEKIKRSLKEAAKKGDKDVCRIYAKELIRSKKAVSKIYASKAHLNSIQMHMQEQLGLASSCFESHSRLLHYLTILLQCSCQRTD